MARAEAPPREDRSPPGQPPYAAARRWSRYRTGTRRGERRAGGRAPSPRTSTRAPRARRRRRIDPARGDRTSAPRAPPSGRARRAWRACDGTRAARRRRRGMTCRGLTCRFRFRWRRRGARGEFAEGGEEGGDADRDALRLGGVGWVAGWIGAPKKTRRASGWSVMKVRASLATYSRLSSARDPSASTRPRHFFTAASCAGRRGGEEDVRAAVQTRLGFLRGEVGAQALDRLGVGGDEVHRVQAPLRLATLREVLHEGHPGARQIAHPARRRHHAHGDRIQDEHLPLPAALRGHLAEHVVEDAPACERAKTRVVIGRRHRAGREGRASTMSPRGAGIGVIFFRRRGRRDVLTSTASAMARHPRGCWHRHSSTSQPSRAPPTRDRLSRGDGCGDVRAGRWRRTFGGRPHRPSSATGSTPRVARHRGDRRARRGCRRVGVRAYGGVERATPPRSTSAAADVPPTPPSRRRGRLRLPLVALLVEARAALDARSARPMTTTSPSRASPFARARHRRRARRARVHARRGAEGWSASTRNTTRTSPAPWPSSTASATASSDSAETPRPIAPFSETPANPFPTHRRRPNAPRRKHVERAISAVAALPRSRRPHRRVTRSTRRPRACLSRVHRPSDTSRPCPSRTLAAHLTRQCAPAGRR